MKYSKQKLAEIFDEDYFERGPETGKSIYQHYHWLPKMTFGMARAFINEMKPQKHETIIDYGCAKGFFVKALRRLGYQAYGVDISKYAIEHADPEVKKYVFIKPKGHYHLGFTKDVLEHSFSDEGFLTNPAVQIFPVFVSKITPPL